MEKNSRHDDDNDIEPDCQVSQERKALQSSDLPKNEA